MRYEYQYYSNEDLLRMIERHKDTRLMWKRRISEQEQDPNPILRGVEEYEKRIKDLESKICNIKEELGKRK
ncbi:MAG: hypothetical protein ACW968_01285 [Candidatus Thorarchaeota archaeon]|jgi:hypothetical protein